MTDTLNKRIADILLEEGNVDVASNQIERICLQQCIDALEGAKKYKDFDTLLSYYKEKINLIP